MRGSKKTAAAKLASDKSLGLIGGSLAVASLSFGVYMNTYGPSPDTLGHSKDFTVFAQFAPKSRQKATPEVAPAQAAVPTEELDMTATASIQRSAARPPSKAAPMQANGDGGERLPDDEAAIISSVTLEAVEADAATIAIGGQAKIVRVGDKIPGAGEVLEIHLGRFPSLKTSRGYIVAARQE